MARSACAELLVLAVCAACAPQMPLIGSLPEQDRFGSCADADARAAYDAAVKRVGERDLVGAVLLLRSAIARCPELARAHLLYQDTAFELGRTPDGREHEAEMRRFYAALAEPAGSPIVLYLQARLVDETAAQVAALNEVLRRDGSFWLAHVSLGRIRRGLNQTDQAMGSFRAALRANPRCAEASRELAEILVALGRPKDAEPHLQNYVRLVPTDRQANKQYAQLLIYELGQPREARALVESLCKDDPGDVVALMDLAAVHWKTSQADEARVLYLRVLELDRTLSRAALNLGNLHFEVLSRGSEQQKRVGYGKARWAYLYYLNMRRSEGMLDALDYHVGVPYRLKLIEELLGPADGRAPTLADF